jgi:hypothetical protein
MIDANNILIVTRESIEAMRHWPIELRAIFDPRADEELAREIAEREQPPREEDDAIPF